MDSRGARRPNLPVIEQSAADLNARGKEASIRYEFAADRVTLTPHNATDKEIRFYMVFTPEVKVVNNSHGRWAKIPVEKEWSKTTWFAGRSKLTLTVGQ